MKHWVLVLALIASSAEAANAGDFASEQRYRPYLTPDIAAARFQEGQFGVLQPGMYRVYLYTAWRAMALGAAFKTNIGLPDGLARADGTAFEARRDSPIFAALEGDGWPSDERLSHANQFACPESARMQAAATLRRIDKRADRTPKRMAQWMEAQHLVWEACKAARNYSDTSPFKVAFPTPLPATEPLYWRQLRMYQTAAVMFHAEHYTHATRLFDQIGRQRDHPLRRWGAYLALRAHIRQLVIEHNTSSRANNYMAKSKVPAVRLKYQRNLAKREQSFAGLQARVHAIIADPSLAPLHEATRASFRSARARLNQHAYFAELNANLGKPAGDPFVADRLGDWAAIMRNGGAYGDEPHLHPARASFEFIDWIETLHTCAYPAGDDVSCRAEASHARRKWEALKTRPWLVAALMLADAFAPGMERAALAVKPEEPDYLTVRYHLARLNRVAGRSASARAISDAALRMDMPLGSQNLFREERFAVATSVADAAAFMQRAELDYDTYQQYVRVSLNVDAITWLQNHVSTMDLVTLARQPVLDPDLRARLASSAWIRADLLQDTPLALKALDALAPLVPEMKKDITAYRQAATQSARQHVMLVSSLRYALSTDIQGMDPIELVPKLDSRASAWCHFKPWERGDREIAFAEQLPPLPAAGAKETALKERSRLSKLKSATGFTGDHVLARARSHPADPDLPWLLRSVIRSTKGGCTDDDSGKLSIEAFKLLHRRFPNSEWAKRTRFFY